MVEPVCAQFSVPTSELHAPLCHLPVLYWDSCCLIAVTKAVQQLPPPWSKPKIQLALMVKRKF